VITRPGFGLSIFLAVLLIGTPTLAFDDPLTSTSIRDAYMLGNRKDFKTAEFFARYKHFLPAPETGPHVAAISVETPYGQIVELGRGSAKHRYSRSRGGVGREDFPVYRACGS